MHYAVSFQNNNKFCRPRSNWDKFYVKKFCLKVWELVLSCVKFFLNLPRKGPKLQNRRQLAWECFSTFQIRIMPTYINSSNINCDTKNQVSNFAQVKLSFENVPYLSSDDLSTKRKIVYFMDRQVTESSREKNCKGEISTLQNLFYTYLPNTLHIHNPF